MKGKYPALIFTVIFAMGATTAVYVRNHERRQGMTEKNSDSIDKGRVVLLHGLMRTNRSMNRVERALEQAGYRVSNFGYPSTSRPIIEIAGLLDKQVIELEGSGEPINFVTHSMGGIVLRYYLAHYRVKHLGRVVMIAPPNRGSIMAAYMKSWPPYRWFFGEAGQEIARGPESVTIDLPVPVCELGIIAGSIGNGKGLNPIIPGDDDGTVGVDETRVKGMTDFIIVRGQHSLLLLKKEVIRNVVHFLDTGRFIHPKN